MSRVKELCDEIRNASSESNLEKVKMYSNELIKLTGRPLRSYYELSSGCYFASERGDVDIVHFFLDNDIYVGCYYSGPIFTACNHGYNKLLKSLYYRRDNKYLKETWDYLRTDKEHNDVSKVILYNLARHDNCAEMFEVIYNDYNETEIEPFLSIAQKNNCTKIEQFLLGKEATIELKL